jgi:pimeloyl-ACP methyl ester carboxylesterase
MTRTWQHSTLRVGRSDVEVVRGGTGSPLLILHDELGFTGWQDWHERLSRDHALIVPLQPGYGVTEPIGWIRSYRDLAGFYGRMLREQALGPVDVIGFSAGGYIAAEMAAACPEAFNQMVLVAPLGVRPSSGEIFDFLAVTVRTHVDALVSDPRRQPYQTIYGGDLSPEQFARIELARGETARIGWEPFMFDPSLPHLMEGVGNLAALVLWGEDDLICPRGCVEVYERAIPNSRLEPLPGVGHCPELEVPDGFTDVVEHFLKEQGN